MNKLFNENYEKFYEKNLTVLPLAGKNPDINGKGWQSKTFNSPQKRGDSIGLLTGAVSGVICVDIDLRDDEKKKTIYSMLPPLFSGKKGNREKGNNYFFQYNGEINRKINLNGKTAVELLSTGNQTVLPPSLHVEFGYPYEWLGKSLLEIDIDDLPLLPSGFMDEAEKYISQFRIEENGKIEKGGRHNTLLSQCFAAFNNGKSIDESAKELMEYDLKHHHVPYFTDKSETHGGTGDQAAREMFESVTKTQKTKGIKPDMQRVEILEPVIKEEKIIKIKEKVRVSYPKLSGYGQELFEICYGHSPVPRSRFSSMSVLTLISTLMGNKYNFDGVQPNLYSILITGQGSGKDYPLKFPKQVLEQLGLRDLIGMSNPASDVSLIMNLKTQRTRIDTIDEATRLFRGMTSKNSAHSSSMAEMLNELYCAPCSYFGGKNAQKYQGSKGNEDGNIGACYSPYITMISATTFSGFEKTFTEELFNSGLGSRFLYVIDDKVKKPVRKDPRFELSKDLKDFLMSIYRSQTKPVGGIDLDKPRMFEMKATEKANLMLDSFLDFCFETTLRKDKTSKIKALYNRLGLQVQKIAMVDAVLSSGNIYPKITEKNVEWAVGWILANAKSVENYINTMISSNSFEAEMNKVESIIFEAGDKGITKTVVSRESQNIKDYNNLLARLLQSEKIYKIKLDSDAPQTMRYIHETFISKV